MFKWIKNAAEGLISPISDIVGQVVTDKDERNRLVQQIKMKVIEQMASEMEARRDIIVAEASSESWLTRSWRPITMLSFLVLLFVYWFGLAPEYVISQPELMTEVFEMIKIGIGGYIGSRGMEKMADKYLKAKKDEL